MGESLFMFTMIIGYESNPIKQIVAIGEVSAEQDARRFILRKPMG